MSGIEFTADGFVVDAGLLAEAFAVPAAQVQGLMRDGRITSRSEEGQDEHAGRWRLTFYYEARALRLTVDQKGIVLGKSTFPVSSSDAR